MSTEPLASVTVIDAQNPWPGLKAFDEAAEYFFSGRDAESAELLRLVGQAPLTVLFSKSGLGKTSLVQAGLFPRLRKQNILPVYIRLDVRDRSMPLIQQAAAALQTEIGKHGVDAGAPAIGESLWEHLHGRHVEWWSGKNQPLTPLFVFDQFEEAFTLGAENADAIERLRLDLADLIENRIPATLAQRIEGGASAEHLDLRGQRYKVLLSFREDFLPEVEGWKGELPSLMRNRLRLLPMGADRALEVVSGNAPTGRTHELVSEETAREIVRFVAAVQTGEEKAGRGKSTRKLVDQAWEQLEIEPALLSLVCAGLNEKRKLRAQATIEAALLKETGAAIIDDFYQRCIVDVPDKTRRFIEDALITEGGFRNSYPLQDALAQGALTEPLLRQLVDRRLLRVDHQLGADRVELIHDRLTDVVREHRDRERQRMRARQQRRMRWLVSSVVVVLGAIGAVFFFLWQNAQQALREALSGKLVMQSRAILEGQKIATTDIALLLGAAGHGLQLDKEAYGGLQYALKATLGLVRVVRFPDPVIAVSPDRRTVVTVRDNTLRMWDAIGQPRGALLQEHTRRVSSVAFSPDGTILVSGSDDKNLRLWDAATGQPRGAPLQGHDDWVTSVAFSPDGKTIVSGSADTTLRVWNVATGQPRGAPLQGHTEWVSSVSFSPDGNTLASGSGDKTVRLWDAATGQPRGASLQGHAGTVSSVAFSPDGNTLASGSGDNTMRLWDAATRQPRGVPLPGHAGTVSSVAFSPDGETIVSGSADTTLRVWNVATGQPRGAPLQGHKAPVSSVAYDGKTLVSGSADTTLCLWDTTGQPRSALLQGHTDEVSSVAFSPDGKTLVSGSYDRTLRLWDATTGKELVMIGGGSANADAVYSVAFSPDGNSLASGSGDNTVRLWDLEHPKAEPRVLPGHDGGVRTLAFDPQGRWLATGGFLDNTVRLWDLEHPEAEPRVLRGHEGGVSTLAFDPQGRWLAIGGKEDTARLWDLDHPEAEPRVLLGHEGGVSSVAFSPDGKTLASGSGDNTVRLWDAATGQPRSAPLLGHTKWVSSVAFSPDGKTLASGSGDNTVRLWDAASGQPRGAPLQGHTGAVSSVAFSSDGKTIVSGSADTTLRLWDAATEGIDRVCAKVVRNLSRADWNQYAGDIPYVEQCPGLPVPAD